MKKFGFLEVILILLTILVALIIFTIGLAIYYPNVTSSVTAEAKQSIMDGNSPVMSILRTIKERVSDSANYRIKPFFGKSPKDEAEKEDISAKPSAVRPTIDGQKCVQCHIKELGNNIFEQRTSANIYIDHQRHEASDVGCNECHDYNKHGSMGRPQPVKEEICLNCHKANKVSTKCETCHPPGSIDPMISDERRNQFLNGREAIKVSMMDPGFGKPDHAWLSGENDPPCRKCHNTKEGYLNLDFCNQCHIMFHNNIPTWKPSHGGLLLGQGYEFSNCWKCHTPTWCAATCHSNSIHPGERRSGFMPIPRIPLE